MNPTASLLLPQQPNIGRGSWSLADQRLCALVTHWFMERTERARLIFQQPRAPSPPLSQTEVQSLAHILTETLIHRVFNYQSRAHLEPLLRQTQVQIAHHIEAGQPLKLFFLYNGGYRASPLSTESPLVFEPDPTELMLLYQIALLQEKVTALYRPGIQFFIVINNGVAAWVNDIPLQATAHYAKQFRQMIQWIGASDSVKLLLQSELSGFNPHPVFNPTQPLNPLSSKDHHVVERFLGRPCNTREAAFRQALYVSAEAQWAQDLSPIVHAHQGVLMKQVAHPRMLSFRPFPGGATRIQNGTLGFKEVSEQLHPKLITTVTTQAATVKVVPWVSPWVSQGSPS